MPNTRTAPMHFSPTATRQAMLRRRPIGYGVGMGLDSGSGSASITYGEPPRDNWTTYAIVGAVAMAAVAGVVMYKKGIIG